MAEVVVPGGWHPSVYDRMDGLIGEALKQSALDVHGQPKYAFGKDPAIAAFAGALVLETSDPVFCHEIGDLMDYRTLMRAHPEPIRPSAELNFWQKVFQFIRTRFPDDFPGDITSVDANRQHLRQIVFDEGMLYSGILQYLVGHVNVSTNNEYRSGPPKLFGLALQQALGRPLNILDGGAATNRVIKMLALPDPSVHPYGKLQVMLQGPDGPVAEPGGSLSRRANQALARPLGVKIGMGVEVFDDSAWSENCYTRPAEASEAAKARYRFLEDLQLPGVDLVLFDLLDKQNRLEAPRIFDLGLAMTVLNQIDDADQPDFIHALAEYVRGEGHIIAFDFFQKDPTVPLGIRAVPSWDDYTYQMHVMSMASPEDGFKHLFTAENGRCRRIIAMDEDKIKIGNRSYSGVDLIRGL